MNWNDEMMKAEAVDNRTSRERVPHRIIGGKSYEVKVGDILLTQRGKTFFVTGWNTITETVEGITTDDVKLFVAGPAKLFNCVFKEV